MSYNAGERKDVRRAEKDARLADRQRREFMFSIMSTVPGRRWMLEKLEECHIFATSYNRDPITMAFMEGERRIGLLLLNDIMQSCPDEYIQMMRERNERNASRDTTSERSERTDGNGSDQGYSDTDSTPDADSDSGTEANTDARS